MATDQSEPSLAGEQATAVPAAAPLVSIVIDNYNYERYLGQAIESAVTQTYPNVEVIVVDDGSLDGSRAVIEGYAGRVIPVLKENGGHGSALNAGFARSTGTIVFFLDSDDYLYPTTVERVVAVFGDNASKVQYRLTVVDADGRQHGEYPPPDAPLHRGDVVPILLARGHYTTAVTSGNAYSRRALEAIMPMPADEFRQGAEGYINASVPFLGEVVAIDEQLGAYRVHGGNFMSVGEGLDVDRFLFYIRHQMTLERIILERARAAGIATRGGLLSRYAGHLESRLAVLRLDPGGHHVPGDRRLRLMRNGIVATWRHLDISTTRRVADTVWFAAVGLLPQAIARKAIAWKYTRSSRPRVVQLLVRQVRRLTG